MLLFVQFHACFFQVNYLSIFGSKTAPETMRRILSKVIGADLACAMTWKGSQSKSAFHGTKLAEVVLSE